ncbi:MAG TPA: serine/threonine-protein kinase [Actinocatenispora sp.]
MSVLADGRDVPPGVLGYSDLRLISRGSTARVYRATQAGPGRRVALKVLRLDDEVTTITHVQRELATMVELSAQPHIVSIIDTGSTVEGEPYLAMEYCEDGSYAGILHRHGPIAVDEVVDLGIKVAEALTAAHTAGIVHRDVKPENVLRSRFGPALTDFGISRGVREKSSSLTLVKMSPYHASPEALRRQPQCPRSDIFGLGSTMWMLLAGWPPFAPAGQLRPDVFEYRNAVLGRPAPAVPRGDVPHWLQQVISRARRDRPRRTRCPGAGRRPAPGPQPPLAPGPHRARAAAPRGRRRAGLRALRRTGPHRPLTVHIGPHAQSTGDCPHTTVAPARSPGPPCRRARSVRHGRPSRGLGGGVVLVAGRHRAGELLVQRLQLGSRRIPLVDRVLEVCTGLAVPLQRVDLLDLPVDRHDLTVHLAEGTGGERQVTADDIEQIRIVHRPSS